MTLVQVRVLVARVDDDGLALEIPQAEGPAVRPPVRARQEHADRILGDDPALEAGRLALRRLQADRVKAPEAQVAQ